MFLALRLVKPLLLLVAVGAAYLHLPVIGKASGESLHTSVVRAAGGTTAVGATACAKRGEVTWRCDVWVKGESAPERYLVRLSGWRCWSARKVAAQVEHIVLPRRAKGCVRLRDQGELGRTLADFV